MIGLTDWFNSLEKLDETQLPPKEAFYSKLNNSNITDDDFEHALKVWENLKSKLSVNIMICI